MQSILERLRGERRLQLDVSGLAGSSGALFLARAADRLQKTVCCIVPADEQLEIIARDTALFTSTQVLIYPSFEIPPYTALAPDPATTGNRLSTLYQLQEKARPYIVFTSAEAVLRRVLPRQVLNNHCELVIRGEEIDRDQLINSLTRAGYQNSDMVRQVGDMAIRGGIIDVFCPSSGENRLPLRLDFFGDTVESIRTFDPVSQRSKDALEEAILLPATDLLFPAASEEKQWHAFLDRDAGKYSWPDGERKHLLDQLTAHIPFAGCEFFLPLLFQHRHRLQTFFEYLEPDTLMVTLDPVSCRQQVELIQERIYTNYTESAQAEKAILPPERLFVSMDEQEAYLKTVSHVSLCQLPDPDSRAECIEVHGGDHSLLAQEIELQRKKRGLLAPLADRLIRWTKREETTVIACKSPRQVQHMEEMLTGYQVEPHRCESPVNPEALGTGLVYLVQYPLSRGFDLQEQQLHVLSTAELFGEKRLQINRRKKQKRQGEPVQLETLVPGDIVVHRDHGLGAFCGLINMELAGRRSDFMQIEFRGGDKLYVPVDRLHWVSRYQGLSDQQPRLDRLGSSRWQATKKKVTEAVWKVAHELLDIYARRELRRGHQFSAPGELYRQLEESFAYDETPGQAKAIEDVLGDMMGEQPMDRLICGDVGYGKTEVAVRAAFKAIEDGFQVAVLVPTTVLAEQHAATFQERFQGFPVKVSCINRFRTTAQQREICSGLGNGTVDLVVGTHRLLSKDINYAKLGLLIVDEEHRFGVSHKEKIKKIKSSVDVLTLTATPIPRTLQMSLLGIRDLSVISTPPRRRRSVKTFLARHENLVIREAVLRELQRGGQLFFVHNRVRSIHRVAENLAELVPHARIGIGHGQMPGSQIEDVMVRFINHDLDILVCTTIIESGLDIANANTIIINRADHLGLADIYQLRGRVGRSSRQSYAYLLVPSLDSLTADAKKRLRALMDASELGSGFKLAMNDLQIRGGGNLLGVSQSGHIAAVGYDLYLDLLQSTVEDLKKKKQDSTSEPAVDPEINLKITAFLPEDYILDTAQRYHVYRRLSLAGNDEPAVLLDLMDELEDRYGRLPEETRTLCRMIGLKHPLQKLGISKLEQGPETLIFTFTEHSPVDPATLLTFLEAENKKARKQRKKSAVRLTPDYRLIVPTTGEENLFKEIENVLVSLSKG
ncbi:MAG TPA: transcription-repair coupling factor [Desulfobulbus sp.]|nr:transcription-repair coupling factor [Desulfobulbus sp.]